MKAIHFGIFFILIVVALTSCHKIDVPDPEPEESKPVFFSKMSIDGHPIELVAGKSDYIMDAGFRRENGVVFFIGTIRTKDCTSDPCRQSITFIIRDVRRFNANTFDVSQSLTTRQLSYAWEVRSDSSVLIFKSISEPTTIDTKVEWDFDHAREIETDDKRIREAVFGHDRKYLVSLKASHGRCNSAQTQTIDLREGHHGCKSEIVRNGRTLKVITHGQPPYTYEWSNHTTDSILKIQNITASNPESISVKVTDAMGCVSSSKVSILSASVSDNPLCSTKFEYKPPQLLPTTDKNQFGQAIIRYISADGIVYLSNSRSQPKDAIFKIASISDFGENDRGQKTKKITLQFSCLLYSNNVDEPVRLRGESVFAVAFPD